MKFTILALALSVLAHDHGQWADVDPKTRQWFKDQKIPGTGMSCCNELDGVYAEEDIRNGEYWTRFKPCPPNTDCAVTEWLRVPPHTIIKDPNRHGAPVAWYVLSWVETPPRRTVTIRCFAPGGGV